MRINFASYISCSQKDSTCISLFTGPVHNYTYLSWAIWRNLSKSNNVDKKKKTEYSNKIINNNHGVI